MGDMKRYTMQYMTELRRLLSKVEATGTKETLSFAEGVEKAARLIRRMRAAGKKIILIGNGASAAIASHEAADLLRACHIRACAFNDAPLITCLGNDLGFEHTFDYSIELMAKRGDILICISSSGASMNILYGAQKGRKAGCRIVTLSGFARDNPLRRLGDLNFYVDSSSYGKVEVIHLAVLHCISDFLAGR
jgi:D-sedoheptulose 7-phosphate isomerase